MDRKSRKKILCLHGYRQNAEKFKSQTGALRKILKNHADFHFLSAPHAIPDFEKPENEKGEDQRGWWFTKKTSFSAKDISNDDCGFRESIGSIENCIKTEGPFDGIFGFSQGACLVALLCALKHRKEVDIDFKFVIVVSGFKSLCEPHLKYYESKINVPSLHVIGDTDRIIDKKLSDELADMFVEPRILRHAGGHFVPGISALKKDYIDFIDSQ